MNLINKISTNISLIRLNRREGKKEILKTLKGKSGIYMLLCNTTNKCSISSSLDLRNRMWTSYSVNVRKKEAPGAVHPLGPVGGGALRPGDRLIHRAIEKYGEENFCLIILELCPPDTILLLER